MGVYNLTCGISNISVDEGVEVRFIPLQPKRYHQKKLVLEPKSSLTYPNDIFNPAMFPIKGTYDGEGNLFNIEKNIFTDQIEKRYGTSIEWFIQCVTCTRDLNDSLGSIFKLYATQKNVLDGFANDLDKLAVQLGFEKSTQHGIEGYINPRIPESFLALGVKVTNERGFQLMNKPVKEGTVKEDSGNFILVHRGEIVANTWISGSFREILRHIARVTGVELNYAPEDQKRIQELRNFSGMFIIEEIYQLMTSKHDGFEEYSWNRIRDLVESNKQKILSNDGPIDLSEIDGLYTIDEIYRWNPELFKGLLLPTLREEEFYQNAFEHFALFHSMTAMCKLFSPSVTGEKYGNFYATQVLAAKTLEIVSKKLAEQED